GSSVTLNSRTGAGNAFSARNASCNTPNFIASAGQYSGTGQRVKINVTTVNRSRSAASVNARPFSSSNSNAGTVSPARSRFTGARATAGCAATADALRPVTMKLSATDAVSPTR